MFAASAVGRGPGFVKTPTAVRAVAALLALCCCGALAAPADRAAQGAEIVAAASDLAQPQIEVTSSPMPQLDADSGVSRIDLTLLPRQGSGMGLALGIRNRSRPVAGFAPHRALTPGVDLGVHWRYTSPNKQRFDVTAYRRAPQLDANLVDSHEPSYGARVEMGLASSKDLRKGFVADRGFVGMQLESGGRLTIRRKFGGPMLYYRNTFY